MIDASALARLFGYSAELLLAQTASLSHEQSLVAPPFGGNCVNWLVGHCVSSRTRALLLVGATPVWDDTQRRPYRFGSAPLVSSDPSCLPLPALREAFALSQERLLRGLERLSATELARPAGYKDNRVGDSLAYLQFHEAHHVGQMLYLAPLLGVPAVWLDT